MNASLPVPFLPGASRRIAHLLPLLGIFALLAPLLTSCQSLSGTGGRRSAGAAAGSGKKVLFVMTSHAPLLNTTTDKSGLWLGEFTAPYYRFRDKGYQVDLATPRGGRPPIDPLSLTTKNVTPSNRRFSSDPEAQSAFAHTRTLSQVNPAA